MAVNWDDPCARYAALRDAYYLLVSGAQETVVYNKGPETEQQVEYAKTDLTRLATEMASAQAECQASMGGTNPRKRYAIRGGAFRRFPFNWPFIS